MKAGCMQTPPGMRKPSLLSASRYRCSNCQSCQEAATIYSLHFNAIMCAISNSVQRGDPYSQKIWQLQPPLSDPLPHPLGAERNPHTHSAEAALHDHQHRARHTHTHTHTHSQAGRQAAGEYESSTLETLQSSACQLAFSEMRIPFPSHHVLRPGGLQREYIS